MKAALIFRLKHEMDDGAIVEMVIWSVPQSVAGSRHGFKYRLYFGKGGKRIVGYDNERGKGDVEATQGTRSRREPCGAQPAVRRGMAAAGARRTAGCTPPNSRRERVP